MVLIDTRRRCYGLWQELECNQSLQTGILGLVDDTHAAATELLEDPIMRNGTANHQGIEMR